MKKYGILIIFVFLLLTHLSGEAQLRYGFRFGGVFAKASLKDAPDFSLKNRSGFSGGLLLEWQSEKNGFAPDIAVLYTRYNTQLRNADGVTRSFGRNFIEVPLHLKYKFYLSKTNNLVAPLLYTGPSFMFRLDHKDAVPLSAKTFQPGWDVGIGIDIVNFIQLTAGYRFGLGNSVKESSPAGMKLNTNAWNVAANIIFDF
ncbi:MAG: PorT family protein [Muribaculaceae bacterium]|nr:PorT family protein [Muribaculaceae bacterium]MDE6753724.1 PorT family protein [Muribaculaceae bacterium]